LDRAERHERVRRLPWPPRRRVLTILLLAIALDLALCVAGTAVGGYELLSAQHEARGGLTHADATAHSLRDKTAVAGVAFGLARVCWWPWRPLAGLVATTVPMARAAGAVGPLLDLAADGSTGAAHALDGALPVLAAVAHGHSGTGSASVRLLAGLQAGHASFASALTDIDKAQREQASIDSAALPASWRTRLDSAGRLLPQAGEGLRAALAAPDLLGASRPRAYLLVPENPWDLRATGGFVGTAVLLRVSHGRLDPPVTLASDAVDNVTSHRLPADYIPPPLPLVTYQHLNEWFFRDANWSPDFPTSAALLRYFYWLGQRQWPDGVVAFDSSLLGPLLGLTGPVTVPGIPTPLTSANGVQTLDHYVNAAPTTSTHSTPGKDIAGRAYKLIFDKLQGLGAANLPNVASVMGKALRQKHLLLWLPDPTIAPILARHGWDGTINPTRSDYLYVVDTNAHYNKINDFIHEGLTYRTMLQPDRSLRSTLTITYTNRTPPAAQLYRQRFPQDNPLYEDFVRVYVPLGSTLRDATGLIQPWPTTRDHDKTVFSGYLRVLRGHSQTVTFSYLVPPNADMGLSAYSLTVQKQPGDGGIMPTLPLAVDVASGSPLVRVGAGSMGAPWAWRGPLDGDVTLTVPLQGGRPVPIPLNYDVAAGAVSADTAPGASVGPWAVLPAGLPPVPSTTSGAAP